jgi:hypothetical protein
VQLGLENKKKATWAAVLGVVALLFFAYEFIPLVLPSSTPDSSAQAAAPVIAPAASPKPATRVSTTKGSKKLPSVASLDPTLRLDLLALSEKTEYQGNGRNIFVSQAEDVQIPTPVKPAVTDQPDAQWGAEKDISEERR